MSKLLQANNNWANRPSDERFVSLMDLSDKMRQVRDHSRSAVIPSKALQATSVKTEQGYDLLIGGPRGNPAKLTHWSFGQLAQRAGAPAGYLRSLPAPLAADNINYGIQVARNVDDVGALVTRDDDGVMQLRAITGPNYGRVWNSTIADSLVMNFGDGVNGNWRVPGEFGKRITVTKDNTTIFASDRDMFVFLADEDRRIQVPNRRDGKAGAMARGFFIWNSEVGAGTVGIAHFLFDYVCSNRIVWGAEQYQEIRIRHTMSAPERFIEEVKPALLAYSQSSPGNVEETLRRAQQIRIDDNLDKWLTARQFTGGQVSAIKAAHMADEQRPIETLWDAVTGITAYARGIEHQDARVKLERTAGKLLEGIK